MIKKGYIFLMIGLQVILGAFEPNKRSMEMEQSRNKFCDISEFEDLNYCLICDTSIITGPSDNEHEYAILGNDTCTIEEGKTAFHKFAGQYLEKTTTYFNYISPDCKWVVTMEDVSGKYDDYTGRWRVFYEGNKIMEMDKEIRIVDSIVIINKGKTYAVMDEKTNERLEELCHKLYLEGYDPNPVINEQGDLMVIAGLDNDKLVSVWNIKDGMNLWNLSTENVPENQSLTPKWILQFWGDKNEGKVTMKIGNRDFYEVSYPSGDMKYIGRDMFSLCYSPDGKYVAYSNCDNEDYYNFDDKDYDEVSAMPDGIYILEIETGRTAFIEQDSELSYASHRFQWVEKESFNKIIKKDAVRVEEKP